MSRSRIALGDWLDARSPWAFTGLLYLLRWIVIAPLIFASIFSSARGVKIQSSDPIIAFVFIVLLDPLIETLIECSLLYWLMRKTRLIPAGKRPWTFVVASAIFMALLHIGYGPGAILPSLITGAFLAYTYGHFAARKTSAAIRHTWAFHAAINVVGWVLIVFS